MREPAVKRAVCFIDGQNLFYKAKSAFGVSFPDYDPTKLSGSVCRSRGWNLEQVRFYTGVPSLQDDPRLNQLDFKVLSLGT